MNAAGAILAILGTFAVPIIIFAAAEWLSSLERRASVRSGLKSIDEASSYGADSFGDFPAIPDDLKLSHSGTCSTEA